MNARLHRMAAREAKKLRKRQKSMGKKKWRQLKRIARRSEWEARKIQRAVRRQARKLVSRGVTFPKSAKKLGTPSALKTLGKNLAKQLGARKSSKEKGKKSDQEFQKLFMKLGKKLVKKVFEAGYEQEMKEHAKKHGLDWQEVIDLYAPEGTHGKGNDEHDGLATAVHAAGDHYGAVHHHVREHFHNSGVIASLYWKPGGKAFL